MRLLALILAVMALLLVVAPAEDKSSSLQFVVIRDYNAKPVRNASVVLHPVNKDGKQNRGGFQLKTDAQGRTGFDGVPYGILRVQVLAQGFQTYGEDYTINQPSMEITIKLKRPGGQYSIYDDKNQLPPEKDKKDETNQQQPKQND